MTFCFRAAFSSLVVALSSALIASTASASITLDFGLRATQSPGFERGYGFGESLTFNDVDSTVVKLYAWNSSETPLSNQNLSDAGKFIAGGATAEAGVNKGPFAYLDGKSSGKFGGLGVAQRLTTSLQATPSSDDNVSAVSLPNREVVGISFAGTALVESFLFRDADHNLLASGKKIDITFDDGANWDTYTVGTGGVVDLVALNGSASTVNFGDRMAFAYNNAQFYVNTVTAEIVPEPMSFVVWGGLACVAGIATIRRRK